MTSRIIALLAATSISASTASAACPELQEAFRLRQLSYRFLENEADPGHQVAIHLPDLRDEKCKPNPGDPKQLRFEWDAGPVPNARIEIYSKGDFKTPEKTIAIRALTVDPRVSEIKFVLVDPKLLSHDVQSIQLFNTGAVAVYAMVGGIADNVVRFNLLPEDIVKQSVH